MAGKFKEIDPDKPATYKQKWALSFKFAKLLKDDFPEYEEGELAKKLNGTLYYYHLERDEELTHEMVNNYFNADTCPNIYINHLKKFLSKKTNNTSDSNPDSGTLEGLMIDQLESNEKNE